MFWKAHYTMSSPPSVDPAPCLRQDTSICSHLLALINSPAVSPATEQVKLEGSSGSYTHDGFNVEPTLAKRRAQAEKRFVEVVRWGAVAEGVKRRKVSLAWFGASFAS